MVGTADHMGDPHIDVVSDHAQVVCGAAIGAQEYEVFQFCVGEFNPPGDGVVKKCAAGFGHSEPQSGDFASGPASRAFFARNRATDSFVSWRTSLRRWQLRAAAPILPWCRSNSRRVPRLRVSLHSRDTVRRVESDSRDPHPSRGRANACLAEFLRPSPQWSAPDRCLQCEG